MRMAVSECLYSDGLQHFRKGRVKAEVSNMHGVGAHGSIK